MGLTGLRGRMIALATIGTTLLVVGFAVLTQVLAGHATDVDARAIARARADGVASGIRVTDGHLVVAEGDNDFLDATAWVFDRSGRLIDGSVPPSVLPTARQLATTDRQRFVTRGTHLLYVRPFTVGSSRGSTHGSVVSTVDLKPFERSERRLLESVALMGLLTVAIAAGVAAVVARRSLAAVHHMTAQADQWREHDVDRRFDLGPAHDEITELGRTLDRMLDRISDALTAERRITDEIAHELRTPLTALRAEAQWARTRATDAMIQSLDAIIDATDRMDAAIRTVLDSARARAADSSGCDPAAEIAILLADDMVLDGVAGPVRASADAVRALVSPLLDNARAHRATRAWVEVSTVDEGVVVRVRDDGPGFASGSIESAFTPGWSTSGGHGLGLAVVRRLAKAHGVAVRAHPGPGGNVELVFPTPPARFGR
jgi:two-component system OmpR family sensor kinase